MYLCYLSLQEEDGGYYHAVELAVTCRLKLSELVILGAIHLP